MPSVPHRGSGWLDAAMIVAIDFESSGLSHALPRCGTDRVQQASFSCQLSVLSCASPPTET
jgi:hypothetical protein